MRSHHEEATEWTSKIDQSAVNRDILKSQGKWSVARGGDVKFLDKDGNNIVLTGDYKDKEAYIGTSSRVVMRAALENGGEVKDWTEFTASFNLLKDKTYDPSKKYYLAVVCASSAEGDYYQGAPGSTLIVDNLKVTSK